MKVKVLMVFVAVFMLGRVAVVAQDDTVAEEEILIERILNVEKQWQETVNTLTLDAEYVEGEWKDEEFKEKVKIIKKIYIKYLEDTALYAEEFLEFYKDGERKSDKDMRNEKKDRDEKRIKRKMRTVAYSMLTPFHNDQAALYDITYVGIADEEIDGYTCHQFEVTAKEEEEQLINGDYFFDTESFNLVRVEFEPAKLVKKTMFKMKEMRMEVKYGPGENNLWFPRQFDIAGKGKAMFFIGVKFAGTEYYRNPQINLPIDDKFEGDEDGDDKN